MSEGAGKKDEGGRDPTELEFLVSAAKADLDLGQTRADYRQLAGTYGFREP